ncbi:MAG: phosphoenolpyruvate--protein phosphotransferase, partial [Planctomycetes bacterium]|nr:phosphoenolpyruvate--protein phosphotransferase [Planctomycetota bacterium]
MAKRGDKHHSTDTHGPHGGRRKSIFKGIPVVPGIALGVVTLKFRRTQVLSDRSITKAEVDREADRLTEAVRLSKAQLLEMRVKMSKEVGELEAQIFDAHLAFLEDKKFLNNIREQIARELKPVEVVVSVIVEGYYRALSAIKDEHLRERSADLRDVGRRLLENLANLQNGGADAAAAAQANEPEAEIIFARELLPSDLATIERRHCRAVITELGSDRGHAAVMLRAMNLPSVMGLEDLAENIQDGDFIIVDGSSGTVFVNPKKDVVDSYTKTQEEFERFRTLLNAEVDLPAQTSDEHLIQLLANVSKNSEIDLAKLYNVDGIGLYRSEFHLMIGQSYPDEEEQYWIYREAVAKMEGRPVTIRTMDIGSDKKLPYVKMDENDTHVLGRRSIRLAMDLEEFQIIQLRAILRASAHGKVRLMFPFITSLEDIRLAKRLVRSARRDLELAHRKFDPNIPVGMMVEVPAAALSLDKFVREVSFFSVGTNDLTQYVCAADRNHPDVAPWYKCHNPGMLQ